MQVAAKAGSTVGLKPLLCGHSFDTDYTKLLGGFKKEYIFNIINIFR
jgi:hypothetical protein